MSDERSALNKSGQKEKQHNDNDEIDELRRALLKMPAFGLVAYSGVESVGAAEATSGVRITKEDLTGDGTDDIRLENDEIFIQMNNSDLESRIITTACGPHTGTDVTGRIQTNPQSPISSSKSPSAEFRSIKEFKIVTDKDTVGSYRITREYVVFGSGRGDEIPFEISVTVTLFAEDTFALIELNYENLGDESVKLDQDAVDIHDGFMILKKNDLVGRNQGQNDYRFYLSGQRTRQFENQFTFETYSGTDWATVFDNEDAATYGLIDGHTSPKMWVQAGGGIDYELQEFRLDPGESASYTVVAGVHDGGSAAPDVGQQIYDAAVNRATGELPTPDPNLGNVSDLLSSKQEQITALRDIASPPVPREVVDARAQTFVNSIEETYENADNDTLEQYEESLERLTAAETVTKRMAGAPRADSDKEREIIPQTGEGITAAAIMLATRGIGKAASKVGSTSLFRKVRGFLVKRIKSYASGMLTSLAGKGVIASTAADQIQGHADEAASQMRKLMQNDVTEDQLEDAANTVKSGAFEKVYETATPETVKAKEEDIRDQIDEFFADAAYTYFFANTDLADVAVPSKDGFQIPSWATEFTVDIPDEYLPDIPFIDEPDEIVVDIGIDSVDLPTVPELQAVDLLEDGLSLVSRGLTGLDPTLDDELEDLEDAVANGELNAQDPEKRRKLKETLVSLTETLTNVAEDLLKIVDEIEEVANLGKVQLVIAGLMLVAAVLFVSGIGAPLALTLFISLGTLAGYLAIMQTLFTLAPLIVGAGYLSLLDKGHLVGSKALLNTDLTDLEV